MNRVSFIVFFFLIAVGFACRDNPVGPDSGDLHLSAEDIGVTDLYLRVRVTPNNEQRALSIKRDGQIVLSIQTSGLDTLILCDSLLPRHTYKYMAILTGKDIFSITTAELSVTTLDTTSHNFTWQVDTLGDGNGSFLKDVAIVNDTCVFAVGAIYVRDSTGQFNTDPYNVARWNGTKWTLSSGTYVPFNAVFAFSPTDVWAGTSGPYHFDGTAWRPSALSGSFNGYVTKFWGTSSSNLFMVGTNGQIMHFDGTSWLKMESGTDTDLLDVWGSPDGSVVWACGWIDFKPTVLLRLRNGLWEKAWEEDNPFTQRDDTLSGAFTSVWLPNNRRLFAFSWYGLYRCPVTTQGECKRISFPSTWSGFPWRLRGEASNDIIMVGEYFMLGHFNGITFHHYRDLSGYGRLMSVDQRKNFIVAVGYSFDPIHSRGIVFRGRR